MVKFNIVEFDNGTYGVKLTKTFLGIPYWSEFLDSQSVKYTWKSDKHIRNYCQHETINEAVITQSLYEVFLIPQPKPKKLTYKVLK